MILSMLGCLIFYPMTISTSFKSTVILLAAFAASALSHAQLITFEGGGNPLANGYAGLNWNNFGALDTTPFAANTGYHNGTVSGSFVGFNRFGDPASFSSATTFNLTSLYLTAAWNNGLNVQIVGNLGATTLFSTNVVVDTTAATFFLLNYTGIDSVTFISSGGSNADLGGSGTHFALDNVQLNGTSPVPEPSTYGLVGAIALVGAVAWTRRRQTS
jgi:hypothetical protein